MSIQLMYETIGQQFTETYYGYFDRKDLRWNVVQFYNAESMLTFEGKQFMGQEAIKLKLMEGFPMGHIKRAVTKVDCQPMAGERVLIFVIGQLQGDDDPAMGFSHLFILKREGEGMPFCIAHEIFRLSIHDFGV